MQDALTELVLEFQAGRVPLERVCEALLLEAYGHLNRYRRKGEDEVSEFLLLFHGRIEGLVTRFQCRGLPFRHFLLRTLRWQWNTFRADRARDRRRAWLAADTGLGAGEGLDVAEPRGTWSQAPAPGLSEPSLRRVLLLALKSVPDLEDEHLVTLGRQTGADLAWLRACQEQLSLSSDGRRRRRQHLAVKRSDAYYRRLVAEDEARREFDPVRRGVHESRAGLYRSRLSNLGRYQASTTGAPTHGEVASLLGMPKGTVDSGLHHLKKALTSVYSGRHDDSAGHEQRP